MLLADYIQTLAHKPYYATIQKYYTGKIARRSGIAYIAHVNEGAYLLHQLYHSDEDTIAAYCVHPLFQSNRYLGRLLSDAQPDLDALPRRVIVLAMEYRRLANAYTISDPVREPGKIELGFLPEVRQMLAADKIQNKKDFMKHVYKSQERGSFHRVSERGEQYFDSWLERLGVTDALYRQAIDLLEYRDNLTLRA